MSVQRTIVVPLDGSASALAAVPVATELARVLEATPHILHVGANETSPAELPDRVGLAREKLRQFVLHQAVGEPAERILELATTLEARAIVMCTHAGTATSRRTLGPVTEKVIAATPWPVVLVRPERGSAPLRIEEVLLPYDGTPSTAAAMGPAATLSKRSGARLFVVYVAQAQTAASPEPGAMSVPRYVDQPQHEWPAWAQEFLDRLTCKCDFDVSRLRLLVARGLAGPEIVRLAGEHGIDLIVVAWKGVIDRNRAETAKTILREAPCPILVLRTAPPGDAAPCGPE